MLIVSSNHQGTQRGRQTRRQEVEQFLRTHGNDEISHSMTTARTARAPTLSSTTYRADPLYPRIKRAVDAVRARSKVVAPVDVLIGMDLLKPDQLEQWRRGQVQCLERVIAGSLPRLSRLLRILRYHAHDLNLKPSATVYMRHGKGARQRLRFTKSGDAKLEEAYATHFVWPGNGPFHPATAKETRE